MTNGTVPMGGVIARKGIYDAFMNGPEHAIEFFHGYTYSGHPLAAAAGVAALDLYREEQLFERTKAMESKWIDALMTLKGLPNVLDIRAVGLVAAIDLASRPDAFGARAFEAMDRGFREQDLMIRITGETIAVTPPLIISEDQIGETRRQARQADQGRGLRLGEFDMARPGHRPRPSSFRERRPQRTRSRPRRRETCAGLCRGWRGGPAGEARVRGSWRRRLRGGSGGQGQTDPVT